MDNLFLIRIFEKRFNNMERQKLEHNKKLITAYFEEVWNKGNLDLLDELLTEDYLNHSPGTPNPPRGPIGLKPIIDVMRNAILDLHYTIQDLIVTEEKVVAMVIMRGTQTGNFFGIPPSNQKIEVTQINIEKIRDGRISEHWRLTDDFNLMKQMGVIKTE
jgi:steroid delta-isomerase-like uncharacterized protein